MTRRVAAGALALVLVACGGESERRVGAGGSSTGGDGAAGGAGPATGGAGPTTGGTGPTTGGAGPTTGGTGPTTGGAGGSVTAGAAGAAGAPVDCTTPLANGEPCKQEQALCGGPCVNSWQAVNVCVGGVWTYAHVSACGPNADLAPQCHNSFEGGTLTPCCPASGLVCAGQPDYYPGFGCTPGDKSFCSCICYGGMPSCGC